MKRTSQLLILFYILLIVQSKSAKKYDECDQFLNVYDCYYFPCLDAHYSCGPENHLVKFTYDFCTLPSKRFSTSLTKDAYRYLNHTNACAMKSLSEQLVEEKISDRFTCGHLHTLIFKIYLNCFQSIQKHTALVNVIDFCTIVCDNLQAMIDFFLILNESHINLYILLIETGRSCGAQIEESIYHTIPALLAAVCLDRKNARLERDITDIMFNTRFQPNDYDWT